jgi:hypothetical protein
MAAAISSTETARERFGRLPFERGCWDPGQDHHCPIGLKKESEPVARLKVQVFPHRLWDGDLILAAESSLQSASHDAVPPCFTFYQK